MKDERGTLADMVKKKEVTRVVITRYPPKYSKARIRRAISQLFSLELYIAGSGITWSEGNNWFLECRLEFADGESAQLITDYWHLYLEDAKGYGLFARISGNSIPK